MIRFTLAGIVAFVLAASGCSRHEDHDHGGHGHDHGAQRGSTVARHDHDEHDDHDHGDEGHDTAGNGRARGERRSGTGGDHGHDHDEESRHTRIPAGMAARVGIRAEPVAAGTLRDEHRMQGLLVPVDGKVARVSARFPGPVRAVHVNVGDRVRVGQRLASVESNLSLSRYDVSAPIAGTVLSRQVAVGDLAGEQVLFELADLDELWVDLHLFGADADHVDIGMPVQIERLSDGAKAQSELERILPGTATVSQSTVARARVVNGDGRWRPGTAVRAAVTVTERAVDRVVPISAVQRMDGEDVVFVQDGDEYEARAVTLGERDGERVEVLAGVEPGERVVVEQSFLVKADIEKAGAAHEH